MNVISKLWSAVRTLADNLTALGETVGQANAAMRQRLCLDDQAEVIEHREQVEEAPALPAPGRRNNGRGKGGA